MKDYIRSLDKFEALVEEFKTVTGLMKDRVAVELREVAEELQVELYWLESDLYEYGDLAQWSDWVNGLKAQSEAAIKAANEHLS